MMYHTNMFFGFKSIFLFESGSAKGQEFAAEAGSAEEQESAVEAERDQKGDGEPEQKTETTM